MNLVYLFKLVTVGPALFYYKDIGPKGSDFIRGVD